MITRRIEMPDQMDDHECWGFTIAVDEMDIIQDARCGMKAYLNVEVPWPKPYLILDMIDKLKLETEVPGGWS